MSWASGAKSASTGSSFLTHQLDEQTIMLRQSGSADAPFSYLIVGDTRALLVDSGSTSTAARALPGTLDRLMIETSKTTQSAVRDLVVMRTDPGAQQVDSDAQFAGSTQTIVVPSDHDDLRAFFGITDWPGQQVTYDLGGRVLTVFGVPGRHRSAIAIYDSRTKLLLTGDAVFPGRMVVEDFTAYRASLDRLVDFCQTYPVTHLMGAQVQPTRTEDGRIRFTRRGQLTRPQLPMTVTQLLTVRAAAASVAERPGHHQFDDFAIVHGIGTAARTVQRLRDVSRKLARRR